MAFSGLEYIGAFAVPLAATAALTPLVRRLAIRHDVMDAPDGERKHQDVAIPYLGGLAIAIPTAVIVFVAAVVGASDTRAIWLAAGILGPGLLLALVGLLDDIKGLGTTSRFLAQTGAAVATAIIMAATGTRGSLSGVFWVDALFTVVWVVGVTNALNLIDNMDGLASGTTAIAGLAYFAIAAFNGQYFVASLALSVAGACVGFLVWNRHPARIYMGDSGALFLGFVLAAVAIRINLDASPRPVAFIVPLLVLALPVFDTSLVVVSRIRRGVSPFLGGRDHISHRLQRLGYTVPGTVRRLWRAAAAAGAVAFAASRLPGPAAGALIVAGVAAFCVLYLWALRLPQFDEAQEQS